MSREKKFGQNRIQICLIGVLLTALFLSVNGFCADKVPSPTYTEKDKSFTGTVTPILSALVRYGYNDTDRGIVTYTTLPGQFVYGPIMDAKGNIIKKGDLLITLASPYHKEQLEAAQAQLKLAKAQMDYATLNNNRAIKLQKTPGVIAQKVIDDYIATYQESTAGLEAAKQALITAQTLYALIHERAVFDGVVTKVYMAGGLLNNEPPVLQLAALNPMGVKIKLDHSIAKKLNNINNTITVYPVRGNDKGTGILFNMTKLTDDGIMLAVENYLISPKLEKPNTPIVNNAQPVLRLYTLGNAGKPLAVPTVSLAKNSQGSYVWQLLGNKDVQAGKGLSNIYKAKKVYVKPGQLMKKINNHIQYRALDDSGNLSQYDLVLINDNLPAGLKDNGEVYLSENKYLFMPGDKVKIEVNE